MPLYAPELWKSCVSCNGLWSFRVTRSLSVCGWVFECVFFPLFNVLLLNISSLMQWRAAESRLLLGATFCNGLWTRKWSFWYNTHMYSCRDKGHWCYCGLNLKDHLQYVTFDDMSWVLGEIRRDQGLKDVSFRPTWLRKNTSNWFVGHAKWREISMFFHAVRL